MRAIFFISIVVSIGSRIVTVKQYLMYWEVWGTCSVSSFVSTGYFPVFIYGMKCIN